MSSKKHRIQLVEEQRPPEARETKEFHPLTDEAFAQLKLDRFIAVAEVAAYVNGDAPWGLEQYLEFRKEKLGRIGREVDGEHETCIVCNEEFLPTRQGHGDLGVFRATQLKEDSLWTVVAMCHHCRRKNEDFARILFFSRAKATAEAREKNRQRQDLLKLKSAFRRF